MPALDRAFARHMALGCFRSLHLITFSLQLFLLSIEKLLYLVSLLSVISESTLPINKSGGFVFPPRTAIWRLSTRGLFFPQGSYSHSARSAATWQLWYTWRQ